MFMVKSTVNDTTKSKKMGRPVTTGTGTPVMLRILPDLLSAVDDWQVKNGAESRPDAIRQILTDYLKRRGYFAKLE